MSDSPNAAARPRPIGILLGGLLVGVMDGIAASTHAWIRGTSPVRVWQYVASGAIGPVSYTHGMTSLSLGILFHFVVAFGAATVFYFFSRSFPVLLQNAVVAGITYGVVGLFLHGAGHRASIVSAPAAVLVSTNVDWTRDPYRVRWLAHRRRRAKMREALTRSRLL